MSKEKGYVSIWRDIQDNNIIWNSDPFSKGQAWIDLILMANHKETVFRLGNEVVKAEEGAVITSELKLADKWKWSKKKVRNFLKLLEDQEMIKRTPNHKYSYIFIVNYSKYQEKGTTQGTDTSSIYIRNSKENGTVQGTVTEPCENRDGIVADTQSITINNYKMMWVSKV